MPTFLPQLSRRERRALVALAALAVAGHLIRAVAATTPTPIAADVIPVEGDGDPIAHRDSIRQQRQPLGPGERIDVDRAGIDQLTRLPGVGPALARRIVADRQNHGAFGTLDGLRRVAGFGPATIARLAPHLSFSGIPAEAQTISLPNTIDLNLATVAELVGLPGIGAARAKAIVAFRDSAGPFRQLEDLRHVRGVTAAMVRLLAGKLVIP